jgi:hypothetical protein
MGLAESHTGISLSQTRPQGFYQCNCAQEETQQGECAHARKRVHVCGKSRDNNKTLVSQTCNVRAEVQAQCKVIIPHTFASKSCRCGATAAVTHSKE